MAYADYRLCDVCDGKVFCDAHLDYEQVKSADDAAKVAGIPQPYGYRMQYLGDWAVICDECSKRFRTQIVPIYAATKE